LGMQSMNRLILKQLHSVSYNVSGVCHGSSYSNCGWCVYYLCCLRSFAKMISLEVFALCPKIVL